MKHFGAQPDEGPRKLPEDDFEACLGPARGMAPGGSQKNVLKHVELMKGMIRVWLIWLQFGHDLGVGFEKA